MHTPGNQRRLWGFLRVSDKTVQVTMNTILTKTHGKSAVRNIGYQWPHKTDLGPTKTFLKNAINILSMQLILRIRRFIKMNVLLGIQLYVMRGKDGLLSAIQCGAIEGAREKASANQRPSCHWVRRVLSSAIGDPYKLRCASTSGSVLEFLLLRTLQTGAVGGTPTA